MTDGAPFRFGKHTLRYEDPGIAVLTYDGPMSAEEMRALVAIPDLDVHGGRFQLTICDMANFGGLNADARKIASERLRPAPVYYTAYLNVTFSMRVTISMWTRATNFLQGPKNQIAFFNTHAEAKAWLTSIYQSNQS